MPESLASDIGPEEVRQRIVEEMPTLLREYSALADVIAQVLHPGDHGDEKILEFMPE